MARTPTTADAFNAIAEPRRREILGLLADNDGEHDVTWLVDSLGWPQPVVSKHLGVLLKVGLVSVVRKGKRRMYTMNGIKLQPVFDWVKHFERFWQHQLVRIKERAEQMEREAQSKEPPPPQPSQPA